MKTLKNLSNDLNLNFNTIENSIKTILFAALTISLIAVCIANIINPQPFTF